MPYVLRSIMTNFVVETYCLSMIGMHLRFCMQRMVVRNF